MSFKKYENNPVLGDESTGTVFDAFASIDNGRYRMDFSWRPHKACAVAFSDDGIHWDAPQITLQSDENTGWEDNLNRNCVLLVDGVYKMWYTGQARGHSYIGYAESDDGIAFTRRLAEPIMFPEYPYENASVMNPCVLYEDGRYRMWYSAGETYEPNVLAYAESDDGISWRKVRYNPIFVCERGNYYEQQRIGGCQIVKTDKWGYVLFYIGYEDIDTARICAARSDNGITGWVKSPLNPLICPDKGAWDSEACYKPAVILNEKEKKWMLWYNGRTEWREYIGYAELPADELF